MKNNSLTMSDKLSEPTVLDFWPFIRGSDDLFQNFCGVIFIFLGCVGFVVDNQKLLNSQLNLII